MPETVVEDVKYEESGKQSRCSKWETKLLSFLINKIPVVCTSSIRLQDSSVLFTSLIPGIFKVYPFCETQPNSESLHPTIANNEFQVCFTVPAYLEADRLQ